MTRQVPFVLLGFFVIGCSRNPSVPKNVLPPEKIQAVLWDAMLADQAAEFYSAKDSIPRSLKRYTEQYQQVFQIHKITKEDFKKSLLFYESHPFLLKPILDSMEKKAAALTRNVKPV